MSTVLAVPDAVAQAARRAALEHDRDALAVLIESDWVHLARVPGLLAELTARLGHDQFTRHPALMLIMDRTDSRSEAPKEIPDAIERVERLVETGHDADAERRAGVRLALLLALSDRGQYERARPQAAAIRAEVERLTRRPGTDHGKVGALARHCGVLELLSGRLVEAAADLQTVIDLADADPDDLAAATGELALLHAVLGEPATAERWSLRADTTGPGLAQLCAQLIMATDRLDWRRYEDALGHLRTGRFGLDPHLPLVGYAEARAALVRGRQRRALDQLGRLRRTEPNHLPPGSLSYRLLGGVETQLAISVGDHDRARAAIPKRLTDHDHVLQRARWQLATGRHSEAVELISGGPWLDVASPRGEIDLSLTLATALDRIGDQARSARLVLRALTVAGDLETIGHSLATTDQQTLAAAADREPAVRAALDRLRVALFVPPAPESDPRPGAALTARELLILRRLADGGTAAEIASGLHVSVHTVRNQTQRIYRKLHATSRRHAIDLAISRGLLSTPAGRRGAQP